MNYQPFLEMNILVSDDLLYALYDIQFALIGLLFAIMLFGYMVFSLVQYLVLYLLRPKYKKRPYIDVVP